LDIPRFVLLISIARCQDDDVKFEEKTEKRRVEVVWSDRRVQFVWRVGTPGDLMTARLCRTLDYRLSPRLLLLSLTPGGPHCDLSDAIPSGTTLFASFRESSGGGGGHGGGGGASASACIGAGGGSGAGCASGGGGHSGRVDALGESSSALAIAPPPLTPSQPCNSEVTGVLVAPTAFPCRPKGSASKKNKVRCAVTWIQC
jgi:hypothetical protein